jgi:hypothetical protein
LGTSSIKSKAILTAQCFRAFGPIDLLTPTGVGVEKLILGELAENSSRQDALQAIFSDQVDIFYYRIRGRLCGKRVFQHPQAESLVEARCRSFVGLWVDDCQFRSPEIACPIFSREGLAGKAI